MRGLFLLCLLFPSWLFGAKFYLDPINGDITNDGSAGAPWSTLEEFLENNMYETRRYTGLPYNEATSILVPKNVGAPVKAGDTIVLRSGLHGNGYFFASYNTAKITVMAEEGHTPILSNLRFKACENWRVIGLHVSGEPYGQFSIGAHIFVESHGYHGPSSEFEIIGCTVYSTEDSKEWTLEDWQTKASTGIAIKGQNVVVRDCIALNVDDGINLQSNCQGINNQVINFKGDGMRAQGSNILIERNIIKNCYDVDGNHDDGIQAFTNHANPFRNVIIRQNQIINFEDENQPFRGTLQGIGCFDGPYVDWVIENNILSVDHWHGITLMGAMNCIIRNNTVVDPLPELSPGPAWIRIANHKDGTASTNCEVYNNFAGSFSVVGEENHNISVRSYDDFELHFVNYRSHDYRLKLGSAAVNAGDSSTILSNDIFDSMRPQEGGYDIGAVERAGYVLDCSQYTDGKVYISSGPLIDTASGVSWDNALSNIQDAIQVSTLCEDVDSIFVGAGTYPISVTGDSLKSIRISKPFGLYGGFQGIETTLSSRNLGFRSILHGEDIVKDVIIFQSAASDTMVIENFDIIDAVRQSIVIKSGIVKMKNVHLEDD